MNQQRKKTEKGLSNGMKFMLLIFCLYFIAAIFNFPCVKDALINFFLMLFKIMPVLVVVFIVMAGINIYSTADRVKKYLGKESGVSGWMYAVISGILVSGPPYILYPFLGELKKQGMKNSLLAVFLYNRNVKIPFMPVMIYYFGLEFTVIISVYIIIFSIFNGQLLGCLVKDRAAAR